MIGREPDPSGNGYIQQIKHLDFCAKCIAYYVDFAVENGVNEIQKYTDQIRLIEKCVLLSGTALSACYSAMIGKVNPNNSVWGLVDQARAAIAATEAGR